MFYWLGQKAVVLFIAPIFLFGLLDFTFIFLSSNCSYYSYFNWIRLVIYKISCSFLKYKYEIFSCQIYERALFLGSCFYLGLTVYLNTTQTWEMFGAYIIVLSIFHFTEFLAIALTNPSVLSSDTFVINHSSAYTIAAIASWMEYFIERYFFPFIKQNLWIPLVGIIVCAIGEIFRKTAIFTAKQNFNHIVQNEKANHHILVTHGVYNFCRHPSYVGWFYWSIGTQLILQNPVCLMIYIITSWKFFYDRIFIEEMNLIKFFGNSYVQYQNSVGTGLPFITGCKQ